MATLAATSSTAVVQVVSARFHCGCGGYPVVSSVVNYSAPPQRTYPLFFYAELQGVDFNGLPMRKEVGFTQTGPGRPWLVTYLSAYLNGDPVFGVATSDFLTGAGNQVPYSLADSPGQWEQYFQQLDDTGAPAALPPHWVMSNVLQYNTDQAVSAYDNDRSRGYSYHVNHAIAGSSPVFELPGGAGIYTTIMETATLSSDPSHPIVQPPDQSTYGPLLAPGSYRQLVFHRAFTVDLTETSDGSITELSDEGGTYSIAGS